MGEGESTEWPDDNADPFGDAEPKQIPPLEYEDKNPEHPEDSHNTVHDEEVAESEENSKPTMETVEWSLPVRAAPLLLQFHDEEVTEYPLLQSADGRKTTSLVLDEDLLRIIDSSLDDDGQRRLKVSLSMKREITGFKHQHNELIHKHQLLWLGSFLLGVVFLLSSLTVFNFIGGILVVIGAWFWSRMHLETHCLEFSNSGATHSHTLHGYGTNRPFLRASMALIGSEMAGLLRNGVLETEALNQLHTSLATPAPAPAPIPIPMPVQQTQTPAEVQSPAEIPQQAFIVPTPTPSLPLQIPPPPAQIPSAPMAVDTIPMPGPPIALAPLPMPLPPPPVSVPTPLPLPTPLPPLGGHAGLPLPNPLGLPGAPLPLDAPLPNAPEITVAASPVEDTLSKKEQSDLLSELS